MITGMWNSLAGRVFGAAVLATLAFGLMSGAVTRVWMVSELRDRIGGHAYSIGRGMQAQATEAVATHDEVALASLLRATLQVNPHVRYLLVLDGQGRLAAHSLRKPPSQQFLHAVTTRRPELQPLSVRTEIGVTHDITVLPQRPAQVEIHVGVAEAWLGDAISELTVLFGAAGAAGLLAGAVAAWAISRGIGLPLRKVVDAAQTITARAAVLGQADWAPLPALPDVAHRSGIVEVDRLSASFAQMAQALHTATAQLQASRQLLARSERMAALGSFVAGTAHAINNPLAGVRACLEMLSEGGDVGRARRYLGLADEGLLRISTLVQRMQQYAKAGGGGRDRLDLNHLVYHSLGIDAMNSRQSDKIHIDVQLWSEPVEVWGDAAELEQALEALLTNAVQASSPGGRVTVSVVRADQGACLQVNDQGPGIPPSQRERVFEPFYTTKPEGLGTGLGLWVVWGVVERHRGHICIADAPGGGACVRIWLPTTDQEPLHAC